MAHFIELVGESSSKWDSLDIGGDTSNYFVNMLDAKPWIKISVAPVIENINSYFVENLPNAVFREFDEKVSADFSRLTMKAPPGAIPLLVQVQDTFRRDIKQVVKDLLDGMLGEIDIEKIIRFVVIEKRGRFREAFRNMDFQIVQRRKAEVKSQIGEELREHLEKADIREAVVVVFRSTAEELCERLDQDS